MCYINITTAFSVYVLNKEYVTLNLVFLKWNMILIGTLEQFDGLSHPSNPNFTKARVSAVFPPTITEEQNGYFVITHSLL